MIIIDLLDQDEIWIDKYGKQHDLETMNQHHRAMIVPFLRKRADRLHYLALQDYMYSGLGNVDNPSDGVWMAQLSTEAELDLPAKEWLERTPLMIRLIELDDRSKLDRMITVLRNKTWPIRKRLGAK